MIRKPVVKKLERVTKSKVVKRGDVYVDVNILSPKYVHLDNSVVYGLFEDSGDPAIVPKKVAEAFNADTYSNVCFSGLLSRIRSKKANRMYYTVRTVLPGILNYPALLTPEERVKWLVLAKEHKLLPKYINENSFVDEGETARATFILDLKDIASSMLYIYLSTIRNIREDPGLPKAVLYLVNELGMNFYLAYVLASSVVISGCGHHILSIQRAYGMFKQVRNKKGEYTYENFTSAQLNEKVKTCVSTAIGIQRMVNNPSKYDKNDVMKKDSYFSCNSTIHGISKITYKASVRELFDDNIIAVTMSETDSEAQKYMNRFINNKTVLSCKEAGK